MIVDQVGHHDAIEGLKTTEQIDDLFESCLLVIGSCFTEPKDELGIYGSSDQPRSRYFIFGEPYNEDEVISYLKLYQSPEESHPDVDEQILSELIASYHAFKENESQEEEEEKEEDKELCLWIQFREVTGFVPLTCWKVIRKKEEDFISTETLEERLKSLNKQIFTEVYNQSLTFYHELSNGTRFRSLGSNFPSFLSVSISNFHRLEKDPQRTRNKKGCCLSHFNVYGDERKTWDLSYVDCYYNNQEYIIRTPIALSKSIIDGMKEVFNKKEES